jgi:hypothetical protein
MPFGGAAMPMHDWERVEAGIYHAFHHWWISEISTELNRGLLPSSMYALPEQVAAGFGPDVPFVRLKSRIAVKHVSGDQVVAMIEIISPGNKSSTRAIRSFVEKARELLEQRIHLLILDPFAPGPRDPDGIHAAIWDEIHGEPFDLPPDKPLTLVAYEVGNDINAYVETLAIGDDLPDMPLFLAPNRHLLIPLEKTYQSAWETVPPRWQRVIAPTDNSAPA